LHEDIAAADVRQLVDENEAAALHRPRERPLWDHDRRPEEPRDGGGLELGGGSDRHVLPGRGVLRGIDPRPLFGLSPRFDGSVGADAGA
jgi:hypothetical protein